jgi:RNA polymerase sigma-70 factor (ECF subfamily)
VIGPAFPSVLAAAQTGAPWALEAVYRDLSGPVTGYLRLHGAADPDDTASEAFVSVLTGIGSFSGDEQRFRAWVFTIAHRRLVDEWRRASRRPQTTGAGGEDLPDLPGGDVEQDALTALGTARVRELCADLAPDQRAVLLLRILGDLTVEQVAGVLGKSGPAVKQLQRRALRTLARRTSRQGVPL